MFAGTYDRRIDSSSMLMLPSPFRKVIRDLSSPSLYLFSSGDERLTVYPEDLLKREIERLKTSPAEEGDTLIEDLLAHPFAITQLDNRGRICIPSSLRRRAGIAGNVKVIGLLDHIEVWDTQIFSDSLAQFVTDTESILKFCEEFGL